MEKSSDDSYRKLDQHVHSIKEHMKTVLQNYSEIRAKSKPDIGEFWDAVIITTADEEQSKAFEYQLKKKVSRKEVPESVPFYVYADPPGVKIGSGGSILYSLDQLHATLGDEMFHMRILLICAGGKSQRLPTASILGKLFLPLPFEEPTFHMLDLKIALYLPFLRHMKPGILITCSDDIETYCLPYGNLEQESQWSFNDDGFTALGTNSTTEIGKNHGVYVLPKQLNDSSKCVIRSSCLQVLQKPSIELMKETGAILKDGNVCTDSIFFFDHDVSRKFLVFMKKQKQIKSEIDAYGDFLQPLGAIDSQEYINDTKNVIAATSCLAETRRELFTILRGDALHIIFLQLSKFYHLGTMAEYIENITSKGDDSFFDELNCQSIAFANVLRDGRHSRTAFQELVQRSPHTTVMHSCIESSVKMGNFVVLEYCHLLHPVEIGDYCILSNCKIASTNRDLKIVVPPRCCFHTAAIKISGNVKFVTIAFGIHDDLKKTATGADWKGELKYMNSSMQHVCSSLNITSDRLFTGHIQSLSLWTAKLFPVADSMEDSFALTSDMVCKVLGCNDYYDSAIRSHSMAYVSMADIVTCKSVEKMIEFQENLCEIIIKGKISISEGNEIPK